MYPRLRILEVAKPTPKDRIELDNNASQAVPTRALSLLAYPLAQRQKTFLSDPASPSFEAIAEKLEALPSLPTVPNVGLVRIEPKPVLFHPGFHFIERGLCLFNRSAKHHKVIGVAHYAVALPSHMPVQGMKIDVGQKRANDSTHAIANFEFERVVSFNRGLGIP